MHNTPRYRALEGESAWPLQTMLNYSERGRGVLTKTLQDGSGADMVSQNDRGLTRSPDLYALQVSCPLAATTVDLWNGSDSFGSMI